MLADIQAKEQERLKQEAINNRKRSSRIATRELEREEKIRIEAAQREMEERMEKSRLEEARKEREEAEAIAREHAREARLRERENRLAAREQAIEEEARERERAERRREKRKRRRDGEQVDWSSGDEGVTPAQVGSPGRSGAPSGAASGAPSEAGQSWELKCEVCKEHGWNLKDDADVVCCDDCGRWQHVKCHDRRDIAMGKGLRDWDKVDFQVSVLGKLADNSARSAVNERLSASVWTAADLVLLRSMAFISYQCRLNKDRRRSRILWVDHMFSLPPTTGIRCMQSLLRRSNSVPPKSTATNLVLPLIQPIPGTRTSNTRSIQDRMKLGVTQGNLRGTILELTRLSNVRHIHHLNSSSNSPKATASLHIDLNSPTRNTSRMASRLDIRARCPRVCHRAR